MFPGEHGVGHYSRKPREITLAGKVKMAESEDNLSNIESEDKEITCILDGRHAKNTIRATKNALKTFSEAVGGVEGLTDKEMLDKYWRNFVVLFFLWLIFRYDISFIDPQLVRFGEIFPEVMIFPEGFSLREISSLKEIFRRIPLAAGL